MKTDAIELLISYSNGGDVEAQAELTELKRLARLGSCLDTLFKFVQSTDERNVKWHCTCAGDLCWEPDITEDCVAEEREWKETPWEAIEHRAKEEGWEG